MKCGKCCMCKYSDHDVIHFSNHMCQFFDIENGVCSCYDTRLEVAKDECKKITLDLLEHELNLLPPSCAYRRLYEGRGLPSYHPLVTSQPKSAEEAGQTVKSLPVFSENAQQKAIINLLETSAQQKWSEARFMDEVYKVCEQFELKWLETYPMNNL